MRTWTAKSRTGQTITVEAATLEGAIDRIAAQYHRDHRDTLNTVRAELRADGAWEIAGTPHRIEILGAQIVRATRTEREHYESRPPFPGLKGF